MNEQLKSAEIDIPQVIFETERRIWPYEPGIVFEPEAQILLQDLLTVLRPFLEREQTLKSLLNELNVRRVLLAVLAPPRQAWLWPNVRGEEYYEIEIADWLSNQGKIEVVAHEICHIPLGQKGQSVPRWGNKGIPHKERKERIIERVCNWGAGFILSHIKESGFQAF